MDTRAVKIAVITGITGQDGSYLAEFLLDKEYTVCGIMRRSSNPPTARIDHLYDRIHLYYGDLSDSLSLRSVLERITTEHGRPSEIYNLAAQSHVGVSFAMPEYTGNVDALGTVRLLECVRTLGWTKTTRFYQASTSELYGKVVETPQTETTPFHPRSPYAVAKLYAYWAVVNYREAYGMYAVNGILFNHESPRRAINFVTRKIVRNLKRLHAICSNDAESVTLAAPDEGYILELGNLNARRDWGHAKDYVRAMWMMLQGDTPKDYVVATGVTTSIREFVEMAWKAISGHGVRWEGAGTDEAGFDDVTNARIVRVEPRYMRPAEVDLLQGDSAKIREELGWEPEYDLTALVEDMVHCESI